MATSTSETLSRANVGRLGRLIVACNDDARAQTAAALIVGGPRGDRLRETAARRVSFATEVADVVRFLGGRPKKGRSALEGIRAGLHRVNAFVIGENASDAYGSCARIEAKTQRLYEKALRGDIPDAATEIVARQRLEIAADRADFRRSSMGG